MDLNLNLPEWLSLEAWTGYIEMRNARKRPLTRRAAVIALRKLNGMRLEGQDPSQVLDQSTFMGWIGLFPLKGNTDGDGASRKTFDEIRRDNSSTAIRRAIDSYRQVGEDAHGAKPQGNKPVRDVGLH